MHIVCTDCCFISFKCNSIVILIQGLLWNKMLSFLCVIGQETLRQTIDVSLSFQKMFEEFGNIILYSLQ